jgi:hypothetical protein
MHPDIGKSRKQGSMQTKQFYTYALECKVNGATCIVRDSLAVEMIQHLCHSMVEVSHKCALAKREEVLAKWAVIAKEMEEKLNKFKDHNGS